ncbi:MAG: ABC transporter permease [Clostridia bacterium]|nr:ABC transporter permease [Clostridia bacterium]
MTDKAKRISANKRKGKSVGAALLNIPYMVWAMIFIIVPMFIVAFYAFTDADGAFTLENFKQLGEYRDNIADSFIYAFIATVITLLLAYPFAYFVTKCKESTQKIIMMLVMVPLWMNLLILTYSIMNIIEANGIINNFLQMLGLERLQMINTPGAVILGMIYNYFPYMVLPLVSVMSKIDNSLLEAASDLGSNAVSRFVRVILPLSVPGIVSGVTMVFVPSVSTFYISQKLGGSSVNMIGDIIESLINKVATRHVGAMLALVLMVIILVCIMLMNRFSDDDEGGMIV